MTDKSKFSSVMVRGDRDLLSTYRTVTKKLESGKYSDNGLTITDISDGNTVFEGADYLKFQDTRSQIELAKSARDKAALIPRGTPHTYDEEDIARATIGAEPKGRFRTVFAPVDE